MVKFLRRHSWLAAATAGALLFGLGWLAGTWATCRGSGCSFDSQLFEAIGTWVGGLGTVVAVVVATHQLRSTIESSAQASLSEAAEADASARRVKFRAKPIKVHAGLYKAVGVTVTNASTETLTSLVLRSSDGTILEEAEQVDPRRDWLVTVPVDALNLGDLAMDGAEGRVRTEVEHGLELDFDLCGYRYERTRTDIRRSSG